MIFVKSKTPKGLDSFYMSQKEFAKTYYIYDEIILEDKNPNDKMIIHTLPVSKYGDHLYLCDNQYVLLRTPTELRISYDAKLFQLVAVANKIHGRKRAF